MELVSLQADGSRIYLSDITEDLSWSEQTGQFPVSLTAVLQNVDVGDGRDVWTALGGIGGQLSLEGSLDGREVIQLWQGTIWDIDFHATGRDSIEILAYDALQSLTNDETFYRAARGPSSMTASQWVQLVLDDGGPAYGDIGKPATTIRQWIWPSVQRAQVIDSVLRWAFFRTPTYLQDGTTPNPDKTPFFLSMRFDGSQWKAVTLPPGSNAVSYLFDESNCAEFRDHQSADQLIQSVVIYSAKALQAGTASPGVSPYRIALSGEFVQGIVDTPNGPRFEVASAARGSDISIASHPGNFGPLRKIVGGGGAESDVVLAEQAADILKVFGTPWTTRTVVVPLIPTLRRGDTHRFEVKTIADWYVITAVTHDWRRKASILQIDSRGVLGSRVIAQQYVGPGGQSGDGSGSTDQQRGNTAPPPSGDQSGTPAPMPPGTTSNAVGPQGLFNPQQADVIQDYDARAKEWGCSAASIAWCLNAIGIQTSMDDVIDNSQGYGPHGGKAITSANGLEHGDGSDLVPELRIVYGVTANNRASFTFDDLLALAGKKPVAAGFNFFEGKRYQNGNPVTHWVAIRGVSADGQTLILMNPSPGLGGTMSRQQFEISQPTGMVTIEV